MRKEIGNFPTSCLCRYAEMKEKMNVNFKVRNVISNFCCFAPKKKAREATTFNEKSK